MDVSREQASSKAHWVARQPLLFGLVAAGGVGLYAVVQMAGQPQPGDDAGKLANLPGPDHAGPVPAPDFGPVPLAAAEARIGGSASPARLASVPIAAHSEAAAAARPVAYPQRIALPAVALTQSRGKRRHTGSFAVPSASEAGFAASAAPALPQGSEPAVTAATLVAYQPAALAAPSLPDQLESTVELQMSPRPAEQPAATALIVAQPEVAPEQSAVRSILPEISASPANTGTAPAEVIAAPPIVRAGSGPTPSRLVPAQPQAAQSGAAARVAAVKPAEPAANALSLAAPAARTGIEGLAGLDDSRLADVRPILGETRVRATSAKRRGSAAGVARPSARSQSVEETAPNPDKISALDIHVPARINDRPMGSLPVQVAADGAISLRLGDLLGLVEGQMDRQLFKALQGASAASSQVSLAQLRAAGMPMYEAAHNQIVMEVSRA